MFASAFRYEAERERESQERAALEAEARSLGEALKDRENLIQRKDRAGGWRTPDEGALLEKRSAAGARVPQKHAPFGILAYICILTLSLTLTLNPKP